MHAHTRSILLLLGPEPPLDGIFRLGRLVLDLPVQLVDAGAHLLGRIVADLVDPVEAGLHGIPDHAVCARLVAGVFNLEGVQG